MFVRQMFKICFKTQKKVRRSVEIRFKLSELVQGKIFGLNLTWSVSGEIVMLELRMRVTTW